MNPRKNNNLTMAQLQAVKEAQHVQSFVTYVENDISKDRAWEMIVERTSFGVEALTALKAKCFAAV